MVRHDNEAPAPHRPLIEAALLYARVLLFVLAAVGLGSVIAFGMGWIGPQGDVRDLLYRIDGRAEAPLRLSEERLLVSIDRIPVLPTGRYEISAEFRVLQEGRRPEKGRIYLGYAAYAADGKPVAPDWGSHRYAGVTNFLLNSIYGWTTFRGQITGTGTEIGTFPPNTESVAPLIWGNRDTQATVEIRNVRYSTVPRFPLPKESASP